MSRKTSALLALLLAVVMTLSPTAGASADAGNGAIRGSITMGPGGKGVPDQEITLAGYRAQSEPTRQTVRSDKDGRFVFQGLDAGPDITYQATVEFQGAPYFSEPVTLSPEATEKTIELSVAESTTSGDAVRSTATHFLMEADQSGVMVTQIVIVNNSGDKTYIGSREVHEGARETLRLALPSTAEDVEMVDGFMPSRAFPTEGAISDTTPIYPGDSQRIFQYRIPVTGNSAAFAAKISLPTDKVQVLLPDNGVQVAISGLPNRTSRQVQGVNYIIFSGDQLAGDTALEFKLDNLPQAQAPAAAPGADPAARSVASQALVPILAGVLAMVALLAVVAVVLRRRRARNAEDEDEGFGEEQLGDDSEGLAAEREELVASIALLDDRYEQGKIRPEEYGRIREEKKRRLVEVVSRQRELATARADQ